MLRCSIHCRLLKILPLPASVYSRQMSPWFLHKGKGASPLRGPPYTQKQNLTSSSNAQCPNHIYSFYMVFGPKKKTITDSSYVRPSLYLFNFIYSPQKTFTWKPTQSLEHLSCHASASCLSIIFLPGISEKSHHISHSQSFPTS